MKYLIYLCLHLKWIIQMIKIREKIKENSIIIVRINNNNDIIIIVIVPESVCIVINNSKNNNISNSLKLKTNKLNNFFVISKKVCVT